MVLPLLIALYSSGNEVFYMDLHAVFSAIFRRVERNYSAGSDDAFYPTWDNKLKCVIQIDKLKCLFG